MKCRGIEFLIRGLEVANKINKIYDHRCVEK